MRAGSLWAQGADTQQAALPAIVLRLGTLSQESQFLSGVGDWPQQPNSEMDSKTFWANEPPKAFKAAPKRCLSGPW